MYYDVALGIARLFDMELLCNFAFPCFGREIASILEKHGTE